MKKFKNILVLFSMILAFASCDNGYDIDYTPIHPLGGQYMVEVLRTADGETTVATSYTRCMIGNTTFNDKDKCWVRVGAGITTNTAYAINGKVSCDVNSLSFSGSDIENLAGNVASSEETFTLPDGKVTLKGGTAPSGTIVDTIEFTYTTTKDPGAVYHVSGYRYTGWEED